MNTRTFPQDSRRVSEIGIGTWQLGGAEWGDVDEADALNTLTAAADAGVNFIDTADIYGAGRSESLIGQFLADRPNRDDFFIATKLGRCPEPGWPDNFTEPVIRQHTEASMKRLGVDAIDLTQTHCIPHDMMQSDQVWDALRNIKKAGLIRHFGASVESMDEAMTCLDVEGLASLQIIFNMFRRKPIEAIFAKAKQRGVALIVRLPLASGLLAGKFDKRSQFVETDHRNFNRNGQAFNVGETFAGLPFEQGVELADELKQYVPDGATMAQWALRWCLDFDAVTTVIPGAKNPRQARDNARASDLAPLPTAVHTELKRFYKDRVHAHIRGKY